jgi:integrase
VWGTNEEIEPLTITEARRLLTVAGTRRNAARWAVALTLGLRQGEVLGLQWPLVDLTARKAVGFQKSACASELCDWSARATGHDRVLCRCVCST